VTERISQSICHNKCVYTR